MVITLANGTKSLPYMTMIKSNNCIWVQDGISFLKDILGIVDTTTAPVVKKRNQVKNSKPPKANLNARTSSWNTRSQEHETNRTNCSKSLDVLLTTASNVTKHKQSRETARTNLWTRVSQNRKTNRLKSLEVINVWQMPKHASVFLIPF